MPERSEAARSELEGWPRRRKPAQALALRARIVLRAAEGLSSTAIADDLGSAKHTAGKWRERLARLRTDGRVARRAAPRPARRGGSATSRSRRWWTAPCRFGRCFPRHRAAGFRRFLDEIDAHLPPGRDVHLVLGNSAATPEAALIKRWLVAKRPRYHTRFTPAAASWINQVARWLGLLTARARRRGLPRAVADLERDIRACIDATNADPRPCRRVKAADEIRASVKRFCLQTRGEAAPEQALPRTSGAGH